MSTVEELGILWLGRCVRKYSGTCAGDTSGLTLAVRVPKPHLPILVPESSFRSFLVIRLPSATATLHLRIFPPPQLLPFPRFWSSQRSSATVPRRCQNSLSIFLKGGPRSVTLISEDGICIPVSPHSAARGKAGTPFRSQSPPSDRGRLLIIPRPICTDLSLCDEP